MHLIYLENGMLYLLFEFHIFFAPTLFFILLITFCSLLSLLSIYSSLHLYSFVLFHFHLLYSSVIFVPLSLRIDFVSLLPFIFYVLLFLILFIVFDSLSYLSPLFRIFYPTATLILLFYILFFTFPLTTALLYLFYVFILHASWSLSLLLISSLFSNTSIFLLSPYYYPTTPSSLLFLPFHLYSITFSFSLHLCVYIINGLWTLSSPEGRDTVQEGKHYG